MRFFAPLLIAALLATLGSARAAELTIYSRLDYAPAVARAFTVKTGIAVRVRRPPPTGLADRIVHQGAHPRWALAWFAGTPIAAELDAKGLLARHLPVPPGLSATARGLIPEDASAIPTGIELGSVLLMPKTAPFARPAHWSDLTSPSYRGLLGMADPTTDDAAWGGLASLLATDGWPGGKPFIARLKSAGLHIYATTADTIAALRSGAIQLALVRSAAGFHVATRVDRSLLLAIPTPEALMPNLLVMARDLPPVLRHNAEAFIAFADSPAGQKAAIAKDDTDSDFWPAIDTAPPPALPDLARIATTASFAIAPDPAAVIGWFAHDIVGPGL